ncbi:MAG: hypothetical protein WKF34_10385 [Pyrinomonadaceae bacterium]
MIETCFDDLPFGDFRFSPCMSFRYRLMNNFSIEALVDPPASFRKRRMRRCYALTSESFENGHKFEFFQPISYGYG